MGRGIAMNFCHRRHPRHIVEDHTQESTWIAVEGRARNFSAAVDKGVSRKMKSKARMGPFDGKSWELAALADCDLW